MNINEHVRFLINSLDSIVRGVIMLTKSAATLSRLPDVGAEEAQHSRHAANTPRASGGQPLGSSLLGGVRFIALRPRRPFLGKYQRGLRHFWSRRVCQDYGLVSGPTLKKASYRTCPVGGDV